MGSLGGAKGVEVVPMSGACITSAGAASVGGSEAASLRLISCWTMVVSWTYGAAGARATWVVGVTSLLLISTNASRTLATAETTPKIGASFKVGRVCTASGLT
jgi:hypothetical protein